MVKKKKAAEKYFIKSNMMNTKHHMFRV